MCMGCLLGQAVATQLADQIMSKQHKVHLRGATVSESEKIKATSL